MRVADASIDFRSVLFSSVTPATSSRSRRRDSSRAFTLLEILLTLALLALFATILVGGSTRLLSREPSTVGEVFWQSVQEARKRALKAEHEIRLRFDEQKKQFVLINGIAPSVLAADGVTKEEAMLKTFPVANASSDLKVDFLAAGKGGKVIIVAGVVIESQPVKFVTFYPDGTCTPFRLQIWREGNAHVLAIDPWTCAPILTAADSNEFRP